MPTIFSPNITQADHNTFRRFIKKDFPDTYDKWLDLTSEQANKFGAVGNAIEAIEVKSDEFARFLGATGTSPDLQSLWHFAHEKGMGRKY
jgi:hypothetical protein